MTWASFTIVCRCCYCGVEELQELRKYEAGGFVDGLDTLTGDSSLTSDKCQPRQYISVYQRG